jgi:MoaA/NifB/PqqE/SkfB family radical SAM enzyme
MDEQVQAFIRGVPSALPKALRSVRVLQDTSIDVTVLCAVSKYNFRDLLPFLVSLHDLGVRQVLFQPVVTFSNYPDRKAIHRKPEINVSLDQIEYLRGQLRAILQFEKNHRIRTNVYRILPWIRPYLETAAGQNGRRFFQNVLPAFHCREIYAIIDIAYDGGIQPCGLRPASVSIHGNRNQGLPALWKKATEGIRDDMEHGRYYPECNGCCHHFSRNMLASMVKYPIRNRKAWIRMTPLLLGRVRSDMMKKLHLSGIE